MGPPDIAFIEVAGRSIANRFRPGAAPTLVFLPGYASDMEGAKALALDGLAERRGLAMLRLDYSGTGSSPGEFADGTLALWLEEALAAVDRLTEGPIILVGSSMGGWIALHLALLRPERIQSLIHGEQDQDVPVDVAKQVMARLRSADVQLNIIKGGGHRLSEPHEIEAILRTVANLLEPAP
jgi:pimeloyl-ACP methyl ester carboxylesterase